MTGDFIALSKMRLSYLSYLFILISVSISIAIYIYTQFYA